MSKFILHVDAENAKREELIGLPLPTATETWQPVSHEAFDTLVRSTIEDAGIEVKQVEYGLSKPTAEGFRHRLFGIYHTKYDILPGEARATIGFRNSTDQSLSAGIVFGSVVFVCDNRAFAGQFVIKRRHTKRILDALPRLVRQGIGQFGGQVEAQQHLFECLKQVEIANSHANDLLVRAAAAGVISYAGIRKVRHQWLAPAHEAFKARTGWSLYNAFTEVAKEYEPVSHSQRTLVLTGLFRREFLN